MHLKWMPNSRLKMQSSWLKSVLGRYYRNLAVEAYNSILSRKEKSSCSFLANQISFVFFDTNDSQELISFLLFYLMLKQMMSRMLGSNCSIILGKSTYSSKFSQPSAFTALNSFTWAISSIISRSVILLILNSFRYLGLQEMKAF